MLELLNQALVSNKVPIISSAVFRVFILAEVYNLFWCNSTNARVISLPGPDCIFWVLAISEALRRSPCNPRWMPCSAEPVIELIAITASAPDDLNIGPLRRLF